MTMQSLEERRAIAAMGRKLGPDMLAAVYALYREELEGWAAQSVTRADIAYGGDPRQRLDLYLPPVSEDDLPILLWVHGGGFLRGEKRSADHPFNAHVGRWAARNGMVGAVMNYRLAPDHGWPAGGEDVGHAIQWLQANIAGHGGDPSRIVAVGTSAGAVHVATHLKLRGKGDGPELAGAVLMSGLYGFTPLDERDTLYYGSPELYPDRMPRDVLVETDLPMMFVGAEFDPPRFQAELLGVLSARFERHGHLPRTVIASGHNHFSAAYHIGTADTRLTDEVLAFIKEFT